MTFLENHLTLNTVARPPGQIRTCGITKAFTKSVDIGLNVAFFPLRNNDLER